mmetsp:Transcript_16199/g.18461  ORF Transcript_16199/g.18461 Transcript_16199/m.18461 type:complete len:390 (+) Transcript_16199:50-1219(+)
MAKNQKRRSNKPKKGKRNEEEHEVKEIEDEQVVEEEVEVTKDMGERLTLAKLDAMSDEDEDENGENQGSEWNAEAKALRQAIEDGVFNKLGMVTKSQGEGGVQVQLEDDSSETDDEKADGDNKDVSKEKETEEQLKSKQRLNVTKALQSVSTELVTQKASLPWAEKLDITPKTSLPFGKKIGEDDDLVVDIHDDLKRELAFYNLALEAVREGRKKCEENKIPFSRPEDFFAEMLKTDDHMAKVKDRLIFESKKMDSFEQRKSNREQQLRSKEAHAHRLSEKSKSKKRHMQDVEDWAQSAASNRIGGQVRDDDDEYLRRMNHDGPNKKRQIMDKKYGYGGKTGRFKQNDKKSMNDMSGFNPKGSFAGGQKKAGGVKRQGKRARDSAKARR